MSKEDFEERFVVNVDLIRLDRGKWGVEFQENFSVIDVVTGEKYFRQYPGDTFQDVALRHNFYWNNYNELPKN